MAERSIARSGAISVARANVTREAKRTGWGLTVEALIKAFWPVWTVLALGSGLILLGVPALLPREIHYALLATLGAAALFFLVRGFFQIRLPSEAQKLARLDQDAAGRPAQTFDDALASGSGDRGSEALWAAHQIQLAKICNAFALILP